jgi:O-antigen/teichoic acid export membrane protein
MLKNASFLTIVRFAGDILHFLLFMIFSRNFGPEGIGHYAYALAIAGLAFSFVHLGFEDLSIRELAHLPDRDKPVFFGQVLGLQLVLAVVVGFFVLVFLAVSTHTFEGNVAVFSLSLYYLLFALAKTLYTPAFAQNHMIGPAASEFVCRFGIVCSSLALVIWGGQSLAVALIPFPVGGVALVAIAVGYARHYQVNWRLTLDWRGALDTIRAAWPFGAAIIIFTLQVRVSFIVLTFILGEGPTGLFASGFKFLEFGIFPLVFLALATYPNLSRYHRTDPQAFRRVSDKLYRLSLLGGGILGWGLVFIVPDLIVPLLGERFAAAAPLLQVMAALALLMGADIPVNRMMMAAQLQQERVACMLVGVVVNIVLALVLIPAMGVQGAVLATIIGQAVITSLSIITLNRKAEKILDHRLEAIFISSVVLAAAAGLAASLLFAGKWGPAILTLVVGIATLAGAGFLPWPRHMKRWTPMQQRSGGD